MLVFKCPDCEDSVLRTDESTENVVCETCDYSLTIQEADGLFEEGDLVAIMESDDEEEDEEEDEKEDSEGDDDDDDEEEEEEVKESFLGFTNRDTWAVNLVVQNEYAVHKNLSALIRESDENEVETKVQSFVEKKIAKDDKYSAVFADVNINEVFWSEIIKSVNETNAEFSEVLDELKAALGVNENITEAENNEIVRVFESALAVKYNTLKENLDEKFEVQLEEATARIQDDLTKELSGYIETEVIPAWLKENEIAIDHGIKNQVTEEFMNGLRDLFENHYIEVPEGRYDILEDMADKIEALNAQLVEAAEQESELQEQINEMEKAKIVTKLSEGLADTQAEKLVQLAETIDYESAETFETNLAKLKESFLGQVTTRKEGDVVIIEGKVSKPNDDNKNKTYDPIALAGAGLSKK